MGPCLPAPPEPQSLDLDLLDRELHVAPAVTALLFRKVIESGACTRLSALRQMGKTITLDRILESGAWTDAAITLIGFEHPAGASAALFAKMASGFALCRDSQIYPFSSMSLRKGAMPCWRSQSCGPLSRHAAGARPHSRWPLQFHWLCRAPPTCSAATTSPKARIVSRRRLYAGFMSRSYRPPRIHMR